MAVVHLNTENFKDHIKEGLVLVDFWAGWCGPCMTLKPIFESLSEEYEGKLIFGKLDTSRESEIAHKFGITNIPCLILFKDNKEVGRLNGFMHKEELKDKINELLSKVK